MDRPAKRNAVDRELAEALFEAFDAGRGGRGPRQQRPEAFCAGLDLRGSRSAWP
jgi:enoyl-CoA hydratase/carnithine racemase